MPRPFAAEVLSERDRKAQRLRSRATLVVATFILASYLGIHAVAYSTIDQVESLWSYFRSEMLAELVVSLAIVGAACVFWTRPRKTQH